MRPKHLKKRDSVSKRNIFCCILFFAVFSAVTVLAWLLPLRPTVSEDEKRRLEEFPEFSVAALLDGSFFDGINVWFSDTFTMRDSWISVADSVDEMHGTGNVVIYGTVSVSDEIPSADAIPAISSEIIKMETDPKSSDERPSLPQMTDEPEQIQPGTTTEYEPESQTTEGNQLESETLPETVTGETGEESFPVLMPLPKPKQETESEDLPWGGEDLAAEEWYNNGAVIQIDDAAYQFPGYSQYYCDMFMDSMSKAADLLKGKAEVYVVLAPSNISVMFTRADREFMGLVLEEDGFDYMESAMDKRVHFVNTFDTITRHNGEYVVFRTDHHWTALGAYYAYTDWCKKAKVKPVSLDKYEVREYEGYLGTTYYSAQKSQLLDKNPDTVVCYVPPGDIHLYIQQGQSIALGFESEIILDRTYSSSGSKYLAFLAGDQPKCTLINNDITDGSACMIVKNSQGNPFCYYFTQHYQYVYIVDARYYFKSMTSLVDELNIQDVIFCFGSGFAWGKGGNELVSYFVR